MRPLQNESSGGFLHPTQTGSVGNGEGSSSKVTTSHEGLESSPITVNTPDSRQNAQPPSWEELIAMKAPEHLVQSNLSSPFNLSVVVLAVLVGAFLALVSMPVLPALVLCALLACYMLVSWHQAIFLVTAPLLMTGSIATPSLSRVSARMRGLSAKSGLLPTAAPANPALPICPQSTSTTYSAPVATRPSCARRS